VLQSILKSTAIAVNIMKGQQSKETPITIALWLVILSSDGFLKEVTDGKDKDAYA
jgi:hypothetical protein